MFWKIFAFFCSHVTLLLWKQYSVQLLWQDLGIRVHDICFSGRLSFRENINQRAYVPEPVNEFVWISAEYFWLLIFRVFPYYFLSRNILYGNISCTIAGLLFSLSFIVTCWKPLLAYFRYLSNIIFRINFAFIFSNCLFKVLVTICLCFLHTTRALQRYGPKCTFWCFRCQSFL